MNFFSVVKIASISSACAVIMLLGGGSARASTLTYQLTWDACGGTCGTDNPFATVTLVDNGTGNSAFVSVTETLGAGENYAGTGAGNALEFNLNKTLASISIFNVSTGFVAGNAGATASAFGSFQDYVTCSACTGGNGPTGPLTFDVSTLTGITVADFIANAGGWYFASDILGNNGKTGNVGSAGSGSSGGGGQLPEPATIFLSLSGLGLFGIGAIRKRLAQAKA